MKLKDYIKHLRERKYMRGIERNKLRVKATAEVFTSTECVREILTYIPKEYLADLESTFIDKCCGDGQFLSEILIAKLENGIDFECALSTIYGVDLMQDNIELCQERLLCGREDLRPIVEQNIVCADALRYHYRFDGTTPYLTELTKGPELWGNHEAWTKG